MHSSKIQGAYFVFWHLLFILGVTSGAQAAVVAKGDLYLAVDEPGIIVDRTQDTGTENSDADYLEGTYGNNAQGMYLVSLDQGALASYLGAANGVLPPFGVYHYSGAGVTDLDMVDTLEFSVPAGTYPEGITARLGGTIRGRVEAREASNAPYASAFLSINLLGQVPISQNHGPIDPTDPPIIVNESFEFEWYLVFPGSAVADFVAYQAFIASLDGSVGFGLATEHGDAVSAFIISFDYLDISDPGVTWTSESGAFAVPEPSLGLLVMMALPALAVLGRRRGRRP